MESLIGAIILFLPIAPFLNLYRKPAFLRRLSMFPRVFMFLSGSIVLYLILSLLLVLKLPQYVPVLIILGAPLILYFYFWRAKATFGFQKKLPPGSLKIAPQGPWVDYLYYRQQADQYGPIFKMNHFIHPMICITGIHLGTEFLKNHEESTMTPPMPFNQNIPNGFMRYMPPAIHLNYREKMKTLFSDQAFLEEKGETIGWIIRKNFLKMTENSNGVHPLPYFQHMAFSVFVKLFLGLSAHDPEFSRLQKLYRHIDYRYALRSTRSRTEKYLRELEKIFLNHGKNKKSFFSHFLGGDADRRGSQIPDTTLLRNFIYLLQTSYIDVSDLLTWIFKMLSDHPIWLQTLQTRIHSQDEIQLQSAHQLANRIVLETLRLEQSEYLMRKSIDEIHFRGFVIPKGWLIRIGIRESHRDADVFANPHDFNPDRFVGHPYSSKQYAPFGIQQKSCVGKSLTLWIGQKFILELAKAFEWEVLQDGPRELGFFHWRPSSTFKVRLSLCAGSGCTRGAGIEFGGIRD